MRVLAVVAHSDDETFGLAGTIRWHVDRGDEVYALSLTDGVSARSLTDREGSVARRLASASEASRILGFEWLDGGKFPDNSLDSVPLLELVMFIEESKSQIQPHRVYCHYRQDLNIDHELASRATLTAFRPEPGAICREVLSFEVPSATDYGSLSGANPFRPNYFVDLTPYWGLKEEAMIAYGSEVRASPHSRSLSGLRNLAGYRGNAVGLDMAEAFQLERLLL